MSSPINGSIQDVILELMISNESLTKIDDDLVSIYDALWDFVKGKDGIFAHIAGMTIPAPATNEAGNGLNPGGSQPKVEFGKFLTNVLKTSTLSTLATTFPGVFKASKEGFTKMGKSVEGLSGKKAEAGAKTLEALSESFASFASIPWAKVGMGLIAINLMGKYFTSLGSVLGSPDMKASMKSLSKFSENIGKFAETMVKFGDMLGSTISKVITSAFSGLAEGIKLLASKEVLKGIGVLSLLGVAVGINAAAFSMFGAVSWKDVFIGLGAIAAFTVAALALGALMETGILEIGILAIAGLGLALIPFGIAMMATGEGMKLFGDGMKTMAESAEDAIVPLGKLALMAPGLIATAGAIGAVAIALAAFSAGNVIGGIAGFFGKLVGGSPIDKLQQLAGMGEGLTKTADAIDRINTSMKEVPPSTTAEINHLQTNANELAIAKSGASAGASGGGEASKNGASPVVSSSSTVNSVIVNNGWMPDRSFALVLAPSF